MNLGTRIMVLGSSGSGKSTLARHLGEHYNLPVVHLDALYWKPGWTHPPWEDFAAEANAAADQPAWVIDGYYKRTCGYRLERADSVIYLDLSRGICLWRAFRRWSKNRGQERADLGRGCPDKLDWPFIQWIWRYPNVVRGDLLAWLRKIEPPKQVHILKGRRAVKRFLCGLER